MISDRKLTNMILDSMLYFNYKPEVIEGYLEDLKSAIKELPLCHQIEIESLYNQIMLENGN